MSLTVFWQEYQATLTLTIRPGADYIDGGWLDHNGINNFLWMAVDEATASDTDYIQSEANPSADACRLTLTNPAGTVDTSTAGEMRIRYKKSNASQTINLTVRLLEGTTVRQEWTYNDITASFVDDVAAISTATLGAIGNWNNLYVEMEANAA